MTVEKTIEKTTEKTAVAPTPTPTPTPTVTPVSMKCPGANGTTYTDPDSKVQFKQECGSAYQGNDIRNEKADTMEACAILCVKESKCNGAVWYNAGPQGTDYNYCWLKTQLGTDIRLSGDAQSIKKL